ncbi:MAG: hypothetical protein QW756_03315 [Nitrososphaerota archaeon]
MDTKDYRSFKLAIVADYFINPSRYHDLPQNPSVYDVLRDLGYGILKMPEPGYPEEKALGYTEPVLDQAEEYIKRNYLVVAVGLKEAKDYGVHYSIISREAQQRNIQPPRLVLFSAHEDLGDREKIALRINAPL